MKDILFFKPISLVLMSWTFAMLLSIYLNEYKSYKIYKYLIAMFSFWTLGLSFLIYILIGISAYIQVDKLFDIRIIPDEDINSTIYTLIPSMMTLMTFMIISLCGGYYIINTNKIIKRLKRTAYIVLIISTIAIISHIVSLPLGYYKFAQDATGMAFNMSVVFFAIGIILIILSNMIYKKKIIKS